MRREKALKNIFFSLLLELVTIFSGFIVPRLIISRFGSETNGLLGSISSFVGYITLLQSGVGSVVKAALYKPLAEKDRESLSVITSTAEHFFQKIALLTMAYLCALAVLFPTAIAPGWEPAYSASLVFIIGISTAAQYFLGITWQMLLEADQRSWVYSVVQIGSVLLNTVLTVLLVEAGCSIHIVKGASAAIYVLRPLALRAYARRHYRIEGHRPPNNALIRQRWDGFTQAIAYFIHSKTDVFVLTLFYNLSAVSVYTVYAMVNAGLSSIISAVDKATRAAFGNIIALREEKTLGDTFRGYHTLIHLVSTVFFATAAVTVTSFLGIYVKGVTDAEYIQPLFGLLIFTAEYIYCLRTPYNSIVFAAGHFRETKGPAVLEAVINLTLSILLVRRLGLVGVAIGTLAGMTCRTIGFIRYLHRHILHLRYLDQLRRYAVSALAYGSSLLLLSRLRLAAENY
ncbi:MAG: lipopolysaccharide biosynthesis protein, partial [bacterium]